MYKVLIDGLTATMPINSTIDLLFYHQMTIPVQLALLLRPPQHRTVTIRIILC